MENDFGSRALGSKKNDSGSKWKMTLGRELWALKRMTLGQNGK